ncbi:hypothetical protein JCM17845_06680 [Iodidimonas gelatinilytica]|uniref:Sel1 repeat family protein n=1 Tax=Iodidimonas gelatinilytica TaxID=1236966 RepID=A0A5A7MX77_9PROT|nr:sel1 repeat family protein [Iodidimonas gelatinilytica]GER00045.1 hypothetical protein JCM17845_06680 [Iodidimonas gelatinilytica]
MGELDKDRSKALKRYLARAKTGDAQALYALGLSYATGASGAPDYVAAHKWFNLAAMNGVGRAADDRAELAREMSVAQIAAAQKAAREWLAHH